MYVMCENVTISQTSIFPALHLPIDAKKKRKKNRNERVLSTNTRNSVRRNSYRFNNCVSPALIFIIYAHPKIGIQKFRREMDLIASPSERFKLIFNSAFQRHPVFLSLKNFSISKQLKTWKNRY